ncbi:hypothetical protein EPO15_07000 [bacterium]|nr:MAG: hypothetical protein EPO15_07000 [bacterium]
MRILLAVALLALSSASGSAAEKNRRYVSADIRGTFRDRWDISDHQGKLWMNVSTFGNSVNFSGRPISGSVWGGGNSWSISGGSVSGTVSKFGNSLSVRATIHGPRGSRWVNFELYAMGPMDDPNRAPSLSLSGMDANLNFSPSFNRDYSVSGSIDEERFGDEGLAVACLAAALVLKERPQTAAIPGKDFLNKSAVVAPFLKTGFAR